MFLSGVCYAATDVYIHKGAAMKFGKIIVKEASGTVILSTASALVDFDLSDCLIKNYGAYDIFLGSTTNVSTSGVGEGYRLEVGESISPEGILYGTPIWGRALTADCTLYYIKTYKTKR